MKAGFWLRVQVRSDLVDMLTDLSTNKRDKFDHVLIETTGLANPAPIVQTFFLDENLARNYRLDGIVTVVDCKHVMLRLDEVKPRSSPPRSGGGPDREGAAGGVGATAGGPNEVGGSAQCRPTE